MRDYLDFVGIRLCAIAEKEVTQSNLLILADAFWNDNLQKFEYFPYTSEKSQKIFGDKYLSIMMQNRL